MKTTTLFSALALASAVVALPQGATKPPSYAQQDDDTTNVDTSPGSRQRPQPYEHQQNGMPHFSGDPETDENEVDAVPGNRGSGSGSGSNRHPRPQGYGQNSDMNVDSNGRPFDQEEQDEFSPQQNGRQPSDNTNNFRPQDSTGMRPGQNRNGMMPEQDEDEDQFSPQQNDRQRPGQVGRNRPSTTNNGMMPEEDEDENEFSPQQGTNRRPSQHNNNGMPEEDVESDDEEQPEDEEDEQPEDEDEAEDEDQFSPQQNSNNRRPGQSGIRPGGISAQQGSYPQTRPGSINGIGPGGIGSPIGSSGQNNFGPGSNPSQIGGQCVSQQEANQFVRRFIGVLNRQGSDIGDAEATAEQIIAEDYIEISSSINTLEGQGDNGDTASIAAESKEEWIEGMLAAPPFRGVQTLKVLVFCDQVVWYWNFASVGSGQFPVKGFNLFTLRRGGAQGSFHQSGLSGPGPASQVPTGNTIQAIKLETEFDSLANALDTGFQCTDRDGNEIQTSGSQGGSQGGMANFQNNRPQDQGQGEDNEEQFSQGDEDEDQDNFGDLDTNIDNQFDQASRGQFGSGGSAGGRLNANANLNANSLAGQANGGSINEAGTTQGNLRTTGGSRQGGQRDGPGPQGLAALQANEARVQREGGGSVGGGVGGNVGGGNF